MTARLTVVLPQPDSPTRPSVSPAESVRLTPSTARTAPIVRRRTLLRIGKCTCRSSMARSGVRSAAARGACGARRCKDRRRHGLLFGEVAGDGVLALDGPRGGIFRRAAGSPGGQTRSADGTSSPPAMPTVSAAGRESDRAGCRALRAAARSSAGPPYRDGAAARKYRARLPVSTMRPPYMTATRCATSATTPRSCVIRMTAAPVSAWRLRQQRQHLRLHRDVEGRRRLVGDDQLRLPRHRHGDDGALAHARRRTGADIARRASRRVGDLDLAQRLARRATARCPLRHAPGRPAPR